MKNYERLQGMVAATFTPFDANGEVDFPVIESYAEWIASTQIKGVFVCGTTGEFASLTLSERKEILEKWISASRNRFKVIAHIGSNCQKDSKDLVVHAFSAGADAIASLAPMFFKPSSVGELVDYFTPIVNSVPELLFITTICPL